MTPALAAVWRVELHGQLYGDRRRSWILVEAHSGGGARCWAGRHCAGGRWRAGDVEPATAADLRRWRKRAGSPVCREHLKTAEIWDRFAEAWDLLDKPEYAARDRSVAQAYRDLVAEHHEQRRKLGCTDRAARGTGAERMQVGA